MEKYNPRHYDWKGLDIQIRKMEVHYDGIAIKARIFQNYKFAKDIIWSKCGGLLRLTSECWEMLSEEDKMMLSEALVGYLIDNPCNIPEMGTYPVVETFTKNDVFNGGLWRWISKHRTNSIELIND